MTNDHATLARAEQFADAVRLLRDDVSRVFIGQPELIDTLIWCIVCGGHALIEGAPGLGKTLLVSSMCRALGLRMSRVQCTPDLLPADVVGTNILAEDDRGHRAFRFHQGPLFANLVLADEINRATPKTQSAFLEAMQEHQVTVFGVTHQLEEPFCVLATQNPIEMEGTYPLPEAQLDRFSFKLHVRTPTLDELSAIMNITTAGDGPSIAPRLSAAEVREFGQLVRQVRLAEDVKRLALRIVLATHPDDASATPLVRRYVRYGASPRAAQTMIRAGKARALANGRFHVAAEDIMELAAPALIHRVALTFDAQMQGISADAVVREVLGTV